jgi:hypothetical protein
MQVPGDFELARKQLHVAVADAMAHDFHGDSLTTPSSAIHNTKVSFSNLLVQHDIASRDCPEGSLAICCTACDDKKINHPVVH